MKRTLVAIAGLAVLSALWACGAEDPGASSDDLKSSACKIPNKPADDLDDVLASNNRDTDATDIDPTGPYAKVMFKDLASEGVAPPTEWTDCDWGSGERGNGTIHAHIGRKGDVDWYQYHGKDTVLCEVDPTVTVDDPKLEVCEYVSCDSGAGPDLSCDNGNVSASPDGSFVGCCGKGGDSITISNLTCHNKDFDAVTDDSAHIFIMVKAAQSSVSCEEYQMSWHF